MKPIRRALANGVFYLAIGMLLLAEVIMPEEESYDPALSSGLDSH